VKEKGGWAKWWGIFIFFCLYLCFLFNKVVLVGVRNCSHSSTKAEYIF